MMTTVWVLTREINAYDQEGAYFVAVFGRKPAADQLKEFVYNEDVAQHLVDFGGGRRGIEEEWFYLEEHEVTI